MGAFCRISVVWKPGLLLCIAVALLAGCAGTRIPGNKQMVHELPEQFRQEVVMTAMGLMGSPYRYGGKDPLQGFDCSGLVNYVFAEVAGSTLPRSAREQAAASRRIKPGELREGDLVFFNTLGRPNTHVGIYIGNGNFVNAPSSGGRVRIDNLANPYFAKRFNSARSVFVRR